MTQEERAFWDGVFMEAFRAGLRSPSAAPPDWLIGMSIALADTALTERRKRTNES